MGLCGIAWRYAELERPTRGRWQIAFGLELLLFSWSGTRLFRGVVLRPKLHSIVGAMDASAELRDYAASLGGMLGSKGLGCISGFVPGFGLGFRLRLALA